jgi:hypothetical protein
MRNQNKKIELAAKKNTRVIFCNTPETKVVLDLAVNVDKLYQHIRKNTGLSINAEAAERERKNFLLLAIQVEKKLESIAQEVGYNNFHQSVFIKAIVENTIEAKGE